MDVSQGAQWAQVLSVAGTSVAVLVGGIIRLGRKLERLEKREFGGNSGGLRESVNSLHGKVDEGFSDLHGRITDVATDLAHVKGRFDQHIQEGK